MLRERAGQTNEPCRTSWRRCAAWGPAVVALGLLAGLFWGGGDARDTAASRQDGAADATATWEAELAEIAALRAQVADLQNQVAQACAEPTESVAPTPVPPQPAGEALAYTSAWTVTVVGAASRPSVQDVSATGMFIEITVAVTNNTAKPLVFPFPDFVLTDEVGRTYLLDWTASTLLSPTWYLPVNPSEPTPLKVMFDVSADAGQRFNFESQSELTFRVEFTLEQRG